MANLRPVLFITLIFLGYLLWVEWQKDYGPRPRQADSPAATSVDAIPSPADEVPEAGDIPDAPGPADLPPAGQEEPEAVGPAPQMTAGATTITVITDVLELAIDPVGGTVVSAYLLDYPVELDRPMDKVRLFNPAGEELFIAQSGLLSKQPAPNHTSVYRYGQDRYELPDGAEELRVPLTWADPGGLEVTKTFIFKRDSYDIGVRHTLSNGSGSDWVGSRYEQLQQAQPTQEQKRSFTDPGSYSFRGIGFFSSEEKFEKVDFDEVAEQAYQRSTTGGWLAMIQHYFFAAWIPPGDEPATYSTQEYSPSGWPRYIARAVAPPLRVAAGDTHQFGSTLYVGPKLQERLDDIAPGLQHTVNYGIFTVFSKPLFWLLSGIHGFIGNWGWAIVLLTVLIKAAFFKLTEAQYRSMARMRKLQPRIEALRERYGDDRQRMSQAMMELYKKEKVNPLGGCLPILVQIPIFIALYWVLLESVELRQAPFFGWIQNLSARDPYFILPLLNAGFMILTQRLTPTAGMDPMQRKLMNAMPVVFSVMFAFFPAGLVLYWATNAGLSLAQQWYITQKIAGSS
ncbi:MAG: membrane protein insertase YidC [Xanthomonadales bacterium]|nr:membrane protein insertase YidC [Xanthomonadales bacterium]NIN59623.1 membrane protein insertase YidC [Xanthomonadales bacterium]NIN75036.1 membrane protein insertase YidC [Xanthomonadales bacterium]NIO14125.1 membrane protein insertase YidC [Xanthomonadales bacterium]NIP12016.1 membrane protein insertase YidC [Xanthomonadales bacterium]